VPSDLATELGRQRNASLDVQRVLVLAEKHGHMPPFFSANLYRATTRYEVVFEVYPTKSHDATLLWDFIPLHDTSCDLLATVDRSLGLTTCEFLSTIDWAVNHKTH